MKLRRAIYAVVLMAIYVIATVCSSTSILLCDHHHHHHHTADELVAEHDHHGEACSCHGLSFESICCDHHHTILGENHTDYISSSHRYDSRSAERDLLVAFPAVISVAINELPTLIPTDVDRSLGDESWPLVAAFISHESLRAPPALV